MNTTGWLKGLQVTADGTGIVSHAGVALVRALADNIGLTAGLSKALASRRLLVHDRGRVLADLACAIADGGEVISDFRVLGDQGELFGLVASVPTAWRTLDEIAGGGQRALGKLTAAVNAARRRAWAAATARHGTLPGIRVADKTLEGVTCIRLDASVVACHSEKENAAATWKRTFGFYPLLAFLDRPEVAGGEGLAGPLRAGNAGSNTAADHVTVLSMALAALPEDARPRPGDPSSPRVLARSGSAGATHLFAAACRKEGVGFSSGSLSMSASRTSWAWSLIRAGTRPSRTKGCVRARGWPEATGMIDLSSWPEGSRLILRKERPHPGAQLTFTDVDGHRITAFLTDTPPGIIPGQIAGLELRHRQHARVEDRIRQAKAAGLRNLPCRGQDENSAWLEAVLAAADLICWAKLICFTHIPSLARCEIAAFRYRVLHVAAQLTRSARPVRAGPAAPWRAGRRRTG